LDRD
jgi:hypothetical protein